MYVSQPDGPRASIFTIFSTLVLGLGVNILVSVAVYPAILLCSRSQIDGNIANAWAKKDYATATILSITKITYSSKLQR